MAEDVMQRKETQKELQIPVNQQTVIAHLEQLALRARSLDELSNEGVKLVAQTLDVEYCKVLELLPGGKELLLRSGGGVEREACGSSHGGRRYRLAAGLYFVT